MSPEPSSIVLLRNDVPSVDPVNVGTDSTIVVSLEISSVRVEDMTEATLEDAITSDTDFVKNPVVSAVTGGLVEPSIGNIDGFSVLNVNEDVKGSVLLLDVLLVGWPEIKS